MPARSAARKAAGKKKPNKPLQRRTLATKVGRESVYDPDKHPERARRMALLGLTDTEVAQAIGIADATLYRWKVRYPQFREALNAGKIEADEIVVDGLYKRAAGLVRMPAVKVFYDKDKGEPVYAPYVEHLPPDVGAAKLWLTNRQPGRWKERREVEMTVTLEQQIARLTPEERRQRLLELQAKAAGMLIEGEATEVESEE